MTDLVNSQSCLMDQSRKHYDSNNTLFGHGNTRMKIETVLGFAPSTVSTHQIDGAP